MVKSAPSCMLQFAHTEAHGRAIPQSETSLEVVAPDRSREFVSVTQSPFYIGRGGESDNICSLLMAASRASAPRIVATASGYRVEDRGNRYGLFVNGPKCSRSIRCAIGDVITFGVDGCYEIMFHSECSGRNTLPRPMWPVF